MQTWAKRGFQSALVTGGLLVLGTGIAAADENASPDSPAGPLDVDVTVPVDIADNAFGTPGGQYDAPEYHDEISTEKLTEPVERGLAPFNETMAPAGKAASPLTSATGQATDGLTGRLSDATSQGSPARQAGSAPEPGDEPFRGNKIDLDIAAPIQITGNAIGVGGDAVVEDSHRTQVQTHDEDTVTDGSDRPFAGNAVVLDWAAPVQLSGNSMGLLGGSAETGGSATQYVSETGDVRTDGSDGVLSGNVGAAQFATPVQVTGNAIGGLVGKADSDFVASTEAESGGYAHSDGDGGVLSGNVGGGPLALPLKGNGNAISPLGGNSTAQSVSAADATAGGEAPGRRGNPTYLATSANEGAAAGNIVAPQGAGVGNLAGNAASVVGNAATGNAVGDDARAAAGGGSSSEVQSGGFVETFGNNATASGNIVSAPAAGAGEVFGSAGAVLGNSHAQHHSSTEATAGKGTYSAGDNAALSGNTVAAPLGVAPESFGVAGSLAGNSSAEAAEHKVLDAGGYNGTRGNDGSTGSGNLVQTPVGAAPELFGIGGAALGNAAATASEHKTIDTGGPGNTEDDGSTLSSNLVAAPVALPAQGFGIGGALFGNAVGSGNAETDIESGGWYQATGVGGSGSGNIVQAPVALPGQAHGIGLAGGGTGTGLSNNETQATAGGDASSDGSRGSGSGNIVQAPVGGAASAFGLGGAVGGTGTGVGGNDVAVDAGGDSTTDGDFGSLAGNVVGPQVMPIAQGFGDAASVGGLATGVGDNETDVTTGGDITTSGERGSFSGDILDVPVGAVGQAFGNAGTVGGEATGIGLNETTGTVGGTTETAGDEQRGSGIDTQVPVGVVAQMYEVSGELLGNATAVATNDTDILVGNEEPQLHFVFSDRQLGANELPTLPDMSSLGSRSAAAPTGGLVRGAGVFSGDLREALSADSLPTESPSTNDLSLNGLSQDDLDELSGALPTADVPPRVMTMDDLPVRALPNAGRSTDELPAQGTLAGQLPTQLPALDGADVAPQANVPAMSRLNTAGMSAFDNVSDGLDMVVGLK